MKNRFTLIALLSVLSFHATWSQTWTPLSSGTTSSILGVVAVSTNVAYACGTGGIVLKTVDGGITWTSQATTTTEDLYAIDFTNANNGVAAGNNGAIVRTTDGGITWSSISITSAALRRVFFSDSNNGYITWGTIPSYIGGAFKTTDGGLTWSAMTVPGLASAYGCIFSSPTDGYICDYLGGAFKTTDSGSSWISTGSGSPVQRTDIEFTSPTNGITIGANGVVTRTTDAGVTWTPVPSGTSDYLTGISSYGITHLFAVGGNISANTGTIISSTDGGASWSSYIPGTSRLYGVDFLNSSLGYAVGLNGTILKYSKATGVGGQELPVVSLNAYPNPATGVAELDLSGLDLHAAVSVELFDATGKLIKRAENITTGRFTLERGALGDGVYFFNITDSGMIIGNGKIMFGK